MTDSETIAQLRAALAAAVDMRLKQILYFKHRGSEHLIESKNAEKLFDRMAAAALTSQPARSPS